MTFSPIYIKYIKKSVKSRINQSFQDDFLHQLVGRAARSAGPGGPGGRRPPGKIVLRETLHIHAKARSTTAACRGTSSNLCRLMGKYLDSLRAGISPRAFFSLGPVHPLLP